ncbi:MAG: CHAT domain-containing protein [Myxococcaceae bacterium]
MSHRRSSKEAALRSMQAFVLTGQYGRAREVLGPFEASGDPEVLYKLAFVDSCLANHELAMSEYRRAFASAGRLADVSLVSRLTTRFAYELYHDAQYAEAVRILDALLRTHAGALALVDERDARMRMARALQLMGDGPAAEAELQRLRGILGPTPLSAPELLLDAELHMDAGELHSAEELFEEAQAAGRRDGIRLYQASAVMNRLEVAAKERDWVRLRALSSEARAFADVLRADDRVDLAFLEGMAARGQGRLEESRRLLEQARAQCLLPARLWEVESELGRTLLALGEVDHARSAFEAAIAQVESQRHQLLDPSLQAAPIGSREEPYDALFELFAENRDAQGALSTLKQSLASRLGEEVAEASGSAGHEVKDALGRNAARQKLDEATRELPQAERSAGRDARFVAFVTTETHAWALIHGAGGAVVLPVALAPQVLCGLMERFGQDFDEEAAAQLGAALFPASTLALLGHRFAIILPRCARNFPVAAVHVGNGTLMEVAVVSVAPDVSTVTFRSAGEDAAAGMVVADPRQDLPAARQEAEWTGRLAKAEVRAGPLAQGTPLSHSAGRLLHFATHTTVDVAGPELVLSDSNLTVADILRRRLHADLVVLAACHSGSKLQATVAESLSTAFLRAGSGAVLATLRSVEDAFAFDVVRAFYAQGGLDDPAGALSNVQRQLARKEPPARWAAFFVAGSPEPLRAPPVPRRASAVNP